MNKVQWIFTVVCLLSIVGLFLLPKSIVSNENSRALANRDANKSKPVLPPMSQSNDEKTWSMEELQVVSRLRKNIIQYLSSKKSIIFADSLTTMYALHGQLDSAEYYIQLILSKVNDNKAQKFAGNAYYQLYQNASDGKEAKKFVDLSRENYTSYLTENPEDLEAKNNLALTFVVSENPMKGIGLLKEILDKDPKNQTAMLNLGLLSMQSGQWDKAIQRFESLLVINANHGKAAFYLANSYLEKGDKKSALKWLNHVIQKSSDKDEVAMAQNLKLKLN